jgi:hypothetical protein
LALSIVKRGFFFQSHFHKYYCLSFRSSTQMILGCIFVLLSLSSLLFLALFSAFPPPSSSSPPPSYSHPSSFPLSSLYLTQRAYADGLTAENLPPATVGDRQASLFVKISPPILTTESQENAFLQFRLFDERNNETIQHVTYEIEIRKANEANNTRPLLRDFFHAHNGLLTIKVDPTESGEIQLFGTRDPFQNALLADPGGTVNVRGPILTDGGLYHIRINIFGIDNDKNIFVPENAPKFDSYLSIGDVSYHNLTQAGQNYNTTLISYYDEIEDFNYDPQTQQISWSMPFDWNTTRIQDQSIFVHEEIKLPNSLLEQQFGSSNPGGSFNATVNGQPLVGRSLAIDPFTSNNATIVHYLINKNQILELASNNNNNNNTNMSVGSNMGPDQIDYMSFSLSPRTQNATQTTSSDLTTDTGGIHAAISWEPKQLAADTQSTVSINFSDAFSGEGLNADVLYDLIILDSNGTQIFKKENLTASNSSDSQTVTFPSDEIYQIEVNVKGLIKGPQETSDMTRSGIGRGYVVVPEFPLLSSSMALLVGALFTGLLLAIRQWNNKFRDVTKDRQNSE